MLKILLIGLALGFISSCSHGPAPQTPRIEDQKLEVIKDARVEMDFLNKSKSEKRSSLIKNVKYLLHFDVSREGDKFTGEAELVFDLLSNEDPIRVDLQEASILKLSINGADVPVSQTLIPESRGFKIPAIYFKPGQNKIKLIYERAFSHAGIGLHKFKDPEDGGTYIYSHSEPHNASAFFPCFDQPDIKATFLATVLAPQDWKVLSNAPEKSQKKSGPLKLWAFEETLPQSTYLFALIAGDYHVWQSKAGNIPLRLLSRRSLAKFVDPKEWFDFTKQGFRYFENYFSYKYPFKKYDQIIVPEFNVGAMENIGAVTFTENFVIRGKKTDLDKQRLGETLLHEMAHMWFGDLVTMKWWDDLWLNESFATIMAYKALAGGTSYRDSWISFHGSDKAWGYSSDQLVTTHPIQSQIDTAEDASASFDGITYGKGAAVLKQLAFYIGEENFRRALKNYFSKFAFQNATLDDFMAQMMAASPHDLTNWQTSWLKTAGLDNIEAHFTCRGAEMDTLTIDIHSSSPQVPKAHAFEVALLKNNSGQLEVYDKIEVRVQKGESKFQVKDKKCPDGLFPNFNDHGYFTINLDKESLNVIKKGIGTVKDGLFRTMLWTTLWNLVRDQKLPVSEFSEIVLKNIAKESDPTILSMVLRFASGGRYFAFNNMLYFWPVTTEKDIQSRESIVRQIENLYWLQTSAAKPGSDLQQLWLDNFIGVAQTEPALSRLAQWLKNDNLIKGLKKDPDRRWKAITRLCLHGYSNFMKVAEEESLVDKSDRAKNFFITCQSLNPDPESKAKWWKELTSEESKRSFKEQSSIMAGLFPADQKAKFSENFVLPFLQFVEKRLPSRQAFFQESFVENASPVACTARTRLKMEEFLESHRYLPLVIVKAFKEVLDLDQRCERVRSFSSKAN